MSTGEANVYVCLFTVEMPVNPRIIIKFESFRKLVQSDRIYYCNVKGLSVAVSICQPSFDSSVGRAVDCSGVDIHRSLVRIRLEGFLFALLQKQFSRCACRANTLADINDTGCSHRS